MADVIDAIIAEALGEGPAGMAAVAHVINTRALQTGKTPQQIISEAGQFSGVSNPGSSVAQSMKDPAVRAQVQQIWNGVTSGQIPNPYPGADYFHTEQVSPSWAGSFAKSGQLGNHIFYASGKPVPEQSPRTAPTPANPIMRPSQMASNTALGAIEGVSPATQEWLTYANQGATRSLPISDHLQEALGFLPELGLTMEVFSGGQPEAGQGPRVGSDRHDHGDSADVFFYKDGERLDWANPEHLPIFQEIVQRGKQAGLTGFGAGPGYMQPGSMHLGFGAPAVWGAGGKGANAPDWLKSAYNGGPLMAYASGSAPVMRPGAAPKKPIGLMGAIGQGLGNMLGFAQQQGAPIMRAAGNTAGQVGGNIMRAANPMGTVAGRSAIIDTAIARMMNGTGMGDNMPNRGQSIMTENSGKQTIGERLNGSPKGMTVSNSEWFNSVRGL